MGQVVGTEGERAGAWPGEGPASTPPVLGLGEDQLRALLDAVPARVALIDRERRHRYVNRDYAAFVGRAPRLILGRTIAEVLGPTTFARLRGYYAQLRPHGDRALAGEASYWEGWLPFSGDGEPCFVQRHYLPHRDRTGEVDGYFVFTRDLTDLKRSEALNAAITASALDCIVVVDEAGRVVEFNPAAERVFGLARAGTIGRPIANLIVPPDMRGRHAEGFRRYLDTGEARMLGRRVQLDAMRVDGSAVPVELALAEVRLADRRLFTAYLRDLTASRAAEAEIARQREALVQSERMAALGSLLAGVAHELNNPLAIVLGGALMLEEEAADAALPQLAEGAERVRVAADRCARIVRSFLAMARQQAAKRRPLPVAALVEDALGLLGYGLRSDGILVERDLPPNLPALLGDPDQLGQVLANLLTNARQALEGLTGPRRIRISATEAEGMVEVAVADNGPGIPLEARGRIFDPFFSTKPVGAGTGIGLAVSRGIAEAHLGSLALEDPVDGEGACFVLRVPKATGAVQALPHPIVSPRAAAPLRSALVVDDEPGVAALLGGMLTTLGLRSTLVPTAGEAKVLLAAREYDVVLCDHRMPDISGGSLYAWLEAERPALCGRFAFVTGDALGHAGAGPFAGAGRPVLEKPFLPEDVCRVIGELTHQPSEKPV